MSVVVFIACHACLCWLVDGEARFGGSPRQRQQQKLTNLAAAQATESANERQVIVYALGEFVVSIKALNPAKPQLRSDLQK